MPVNLETPCCLVLCEGGTKEGQAELVVLKTVDQEWRAEIRGLAGWV